MQLSGHGGEVYSMRFSPDGQVLASASFDRLLYLWRVYDECDNYSVIKVRCRTARACIACERVRVERTAGGGRGGAGEHRCAACMWARWAMHACSNAWWCFMRGCVGHSRPCMRARGLHCTCMGSVS